MKSVASVTVKLGVDQWLSDVEFKVQDAHWTEDRLFHALEDMVCDFFENVMEDSEQHTKRDCYPHFELERIKK